MREYPDFITMYRDVSKAAEENTEIQEAKEIPSDVQEATKPKKKKKAE